MNAKKIMGAVLVALLAALFVGAGAAAPVVFVYQTGVAEGVWTDADGKNTIMVVDGYISGDNIVEGIYNIDGTDTYVMYPDAKIDLTHLSESIIGGTIPVGETFTITTKASYNTAVTSFELLFTNPDGVQTTDFDNTVAGEWKVQAYFDTDMAKPVAGKTVYTFTVVDTEPSITISADTVLKGNTFWVTVNGLPGTGVTLTADAAIKAIDGQLDVSGTDLKTGITFDIPESGSMKVAVVSPVYDGKVTFTADIGSVKKTAKVTIEAGEITAEAAADFYYLGTDVKLTGTNTESKTVYFYIKGNNMDLMSLDVTAGVKADKTWEKKIEAATFNNFDAGTYTVYAVTKELPLKAESNLVDTVKWSEYTYATVSLPLKQPFLTAQLSATTVAQDSELIITGTAESADKLLLYIFGNNYFLNTTISVEDDGTYEEEFEIDGDNMATGQYFVVIQHPMYNKQFNIAPLYKAAQAVGQKESYNIVLNTTADVFEAQDGSILFNTLERQSSNAAEALCQALDTQNIDDVYVKATFIVAQPTATMNPVSDVAKGAKLVVSGTSNMAPGTVVTVDMLSTAFAAIPKESVNSASFITLTTKVQDDGTWEVTFDTSGLNVDEYTLAATVGDIKTSTTVVKVLESAPVTPEQPDTPVTPEQPTDKPEQPTEPETPGFGALAALAGLGAVAVLLLRRE